jgi:hypothetical protein
MGALANLGFMNCTYVPLWLACCAAYALETLVEGVPSSELYMAVLSRGSAEGLAGERSSLSPRSLQRVSSHTRRASTAGAYLSSSSCAWARGCDTQWRRRYSWCMECLGRRRRSEPVRRLCAASIMQSLITYFPGMARCEWWLAIVFRPTEVPRLVNNVEIPPRSRHLAVERRAGLGEGGLTFACSTCALASKRGMARRHRLRGGRRAARCKYVSGMQRAAPTTRVLHCWAAQPVAAAQPRLRSP